MFMRKATTQFFFQRPQNNRGLLAQSFFRLQFSSVEPGIPISYRNNPKSNALRAAVITTNQDKFNEFQAQLGDGYGMDIQQYIPEAKDDIANNAFAVCNKIMEQALFSPHYILREESTLTCARQPKELNSTLSVYKPRWTGKADKTLSGFTLKQFEHHIPEYIKHSARQHTISQFIEFHLRYKNLSTMGHHSLPLKKPVDFGQDYIHLTQFVQNEKHLSNPYVDRWGVEKLRNAVINEGLFFKAARSRPVKNYFSPPLSGLPITRKKDGAEETIFMTHDMMHHLIPDLVCDQAADKKYFYVYSAWRMISEACTLVLADMLYADSLIQNGVERTCVDKRIYPLFEAVKVSRKWSNPDDMSDEEKVVVLKQLLFANVRYALLGDDLEWQRLLSNEQGDILPEHMEKLDAYKRHFEKFFIGDHAWTRANFENMHKHEDSLQQWINFVGRKTFVQAGIPLLSEVCEKLESNQVDFEHYDQIADAVFSLVFKTRIEPRLLRGKVKFDEDDRIQSRAFKRFLIGQCSVFSRYPTLLSLEHIPQRLYARLRSDNLFTHVEQDDIRELLEQYIYGIEGMGLILRDDALNAIDCTTIFPAIYISYQAMQEKYGSLGHCVSQCIESYDYVTPRIAKNNLVRTINGVTFIDAVALEKAIGKHVPASDRLRQKMILIGVEFWDDEKTIVKKPVVGISAIGNFAVSLEGHIPDDMIKLYIGAVSSGPLTPTAIVDGLKTNMGLQSTHTYMNPHGKHPQDLYDITIKHKHYSIAHAGAIGMHVFGLSKKAEIELDVKRDELHLARHTSARDASQDEPCLVAMTKEGALATKRIRAQVIAELKTFDKIGNQRDWREERNSLFPFSAALSLGVNATLRNFMKVVSDIGGDGKELEYRNILALMNDSLAGLFPELFKPSNAYHHVYPSAWAEESKSISLLAASGLGFHARKTNPASEAENEPGLVSKASHGPDSLS